MGSDAASSFPSCMNNKAERKAVATDPQSRQPPPPLSNTRTTSGCCGRDRLKRHWVDVAGRVWIPDIWGQEDLLKDWIDSSAFDSSLVGSSIMSARESLVEEGRRASSTRFGIENSC